MSAYVRPEYVTTESAAVRSVSAATGRSRESRNGSNGLWPVTLVFGAILGGIVVGNVYAGGLTLWEWLVLPLSGLLLWTLLEYAIHSNVFHPRYTPRIFAGIQASHAMHHAYPKRPEYIVARLSFTLPVAATLFGVLSIVLWDVRWASLVMTGVITGYLAYEVVHWSIHRKWGAKFLPRALVMYHLHHHYRDGDRCFGVTSPLWDYVFGTGPRSKGSVGPTRQNPVS